VKDRDRDEFEFEFRDWEADCGCNCPDEAPEEPWLRRKEVAEEDAMMNET
jgi:hypothetical protein